MSVSAGPRRLSDPHTYANSHLLPWEGEIPRDRDSLRWREPDANNAQHGLSRDEYRQRWGLRSNHPLTAPGYSERRSMLAKSLGLGRKIAEPVAPAKRQKTSPPGMDAAGTSKAKRARGSRSAPKSNGGTAALTSARGKRSRARVASPDTRPQTDIQRSHVIREPPLPPRPSGPDRARSAPPRPRWSSRSRSASRIRPRRPRRRLAW